MSNVSISSIEDRTIELACYIIENKATIRTAADCIGISKSVAHSDLTGIETLTGDEEDSLSYRKFPNVG